MLMIHCQASNSLHRKSKSTFYFPKYVKVPHFSMTAAYWVTHCECENAGVLGRGMIKCIISTSVFSI